MQKNIAISCGPIPAHMDAVKFITNRFQGGLAFRTAEYLAEQGHKVTIVAWQFTRLPDWINNHPDTEVVQVADVFEYYDWFVAHAKDYDAFIMAAAVANLTPVKPYEGKFPSHLYKPGETFDIPFMIAPRAIDAIKAINPRCCLIGYKLFDAQTDEELTEIARHTLKDARANIIFANHPATAKSRKIAVMPDGSAIPCTFDEHLELMERAITQTYYTTKVEQLQDWEANDVNIQDAMATVELFEHTFLRYGTVAVPVKGMPGAFATTARGHRGGPVLVRSIDPSTFTIRASEKATLNAPALQAMLNGDYYSIIIHRHENDPLYDAASDDPYTTTSFQSYLFPGTEEERANVALKAWNKITTIHFQHHGYLKKLPILDIDWNRYYDLFPDRYFSIPDTFQRVLEEHAKERTLEIGGNAGATGQFSYDPYVKAEHAVNLSWKEVITDSFQLIFAKNAVNYLTLSHLTILYQKAPKFIANTFLIPPEKKVTKQESAILDKTNNTIHHTLRLPDDSIMRHTFFAYTQDNYEAIGFHVTPYGRNSALVTKDIDLPDKIK